MVHTVTGTTLSFKKREPFLLSLLPEFYQLVFIIHQLIPTYVPFMSIRLYAVNVFYNLVVCVHVSYHLNSRNFKHLLESRYRFLVFSYRIYCA